MPCLRKKCYASIIFLCFFIFFGTLFVHKSSLKPDIDFEISIPKVNIALSNSSENNAKSTMVHSGTTVQSNRCGYFIKFPLPGGTRLGNHLFMYASFYGMAKKQDTFAHKTAFIAVDSLPSPLEEIFENLSIPQKIVSDSWFSSNNFKFQNELKICAYDDVGFFQLKCDGQNVATVGYRQSHRYFYQYFEEIKREFTFKKSIQENCDRLFNENMIQKNLSIINCTTVGVHLRRGDFVDNGDFWPAQFDYLKKAVRFHEFVHFEKKIDCLVFVIFGDDNEWNSNAIRRVEFSRPNKTFSILIDSEKSSPEIDLCMMRLCDNMIISTGSFGWWGAFFSRGVVTYQKESARPNSSFFLQYEPNDFYLPHWIPL